MKEQDNADKKIRFIRYRVRDDRIYGVTLVCHFANTKEVLALAEKKIKIAVNTSDATIDHVHYIEGQFDPDYYRSVRNNANKKRAVKLFPFENNKKLKTHNCTVQTINGIVSVDLKHGYVKSCCTACGKPLFENNEHGGGNDGKAIAVIGTLFFAYYGRNRIINAKVKSSSVSGEIFYYCKSCIERELF